MKLKTKFILIVSIVISILSLIAFFALSHYKNSIKKTIAQQQFLVVSALADEIDSKLLTAQQDLIAVAKGTPPDIMENQEKAQAILDNTPILHRTFDNNVLLLTPAGKIFVESPFAPGRRGLDLSFREYLINTLKTKKTYISDPYVSTKPPKHPVIILTVPLFDGKGKIKGILAGSIDLMSDNFLGRLSTLKIGATGYLILTAADRTLIMHPDKKRILTKQAPGLNRLYDKAIEGFEGTDETTTSYGTKMVSSFKRLKAKDWILAASYPQAEAYSPIRVAERYFLIIAVTGIISAFWGIYLSIKFLIEPLELFTRHIEELPQKTGDDRFLDIKTKDEIGTLSLAFNKMVTEIDKRPALERSEELYRTVMEFSTDFVFWRAPDNKLIYVSENCEKFCGYTEEEFYASPELLETIIYPEDHALWAEHHTNSINGKGICEHLELRIITKSGEVRWIDHNCLPVYDKEGNYRGWRASHQNITGRKLAEEALRKSEDKYRSLFEESKDVVFISTPEGRFIDINKAGVELFGYSSKEKLLEADIEKNLYVNLGYRKELMKILEAQGYVKDYELLMKNKNGNILILLDTATAFRDKMGRVTSYRGILRDITHQRKLEQQLMQAQKMEAVGQLAGGIAHDFNNFLTAIIGYGSLLQMEMNEGHPLRAYVQQILGSAERAANLTKQLLIFSRKHSIDPRPAKINEIIFALEKLISRLIGEDIEMQLVLSRADLIIRADVGQIEQVLMNLATNARDAMPNGGLLTIKTEAVVMDKEFIRAHGYGEEGPYVVITVSDTGEGMDEKTMKKIFEPFFTTKEAGKGTGLGLAMVYGIVKQHNGCISVYSEHGKGASFRIYLPLIGDAVEDQLTLVQPEAIGGTETVLLAEDDLAVRKMMTGLLRDFGYTVLEAIDGEDAVERFREHKDNIELIIFDVIMPKKNGKEAYNEVAKMKPGIKAIFASGYPADVVRRKGIIEEGVEFISKPFAPSEFLKTIRKVLDK